MNSEKIQELYRYYTVNIQFLQHDAAYHTQQQTVNNVHTIIVHYQQQYRNLFDVIVKQCDIIEHKKMNTNPNIITEHNEVIIKKSNTTSTIISSKDVDSDYYSEESSPISNKTYTLSLSDRNTRLLNKDTINILNNWYSKHLLHPYPTAEETQHLSTQSNITTSQVRKWMANKRMRNQNTKQQKLSSRKKMMHRKHVC